MDDLILDASREPCLEAIHGYISESRRFLWQGINEFIQQEFRVQPHLTYSKCSGKPGWNIKYKRSGKSLCTLYPEKKGFTALVVVPDFLGPVIKGMEEDFGPTLVEIVSQAKPFNGTIWLMVPVYQPAELENVKQLIHLKMQN